ncbi:MAG: hypothetical protein WCS65_17065 [Verrucomicrobiae bacterium]
MNVLHQPEVIPSPLGRGWTVVRGGRDADGGFERWIGQHFPTHDQAEVAALDWEWRTPSTEDAP